MLPADRQGLLPSRSTWLGCSRVWGMGYRVMNRGLPVGGRLPCSRHGAAWAADAAAPMAGMVDSTSTVNMAEPAKALYLFGLGIGM